MIKNKKEIIDYYFNNPKSNSNKEMTKRFNICDETFSKIISNELKRRVENSLTRKFIKKYSK
jgi:hypothetical protein|tara:strand:- start:64 stop:249 length:186 start_codon:yes stop_codon:yes gene_type:complete